MPYAGDHILAALKAARTEKGLSQRELSKEAGVPQSHISKIEAGAVDLQLSSLIEIARALDLEVLTVPRKLVPAVRAIVRSNESDTLRHLGNIHESQKYLKRIRKNADHLKSIPEIRKDLLNLQRLVGELKNFRIGPDELRRIKSASELVQKAVKDPKEKNLIQSAATELRHLRNSLAHNGVEPAQAIRPAYTLDEDSDA
jgi:transcriptional regulator with XRE-family HTH domain